jgi:hypothetical protein
MTQETAAIRTAMASHRPLNRRAIVGGAAGAAAGLVTRLGAPLPAAAEDATPAAKPMAQHPVVGLWRFTNDAGGGNTFPSIGIFHADGTYIEDFADPGAFSMGVWEPTGERTVTVTVYQVYTFDDKLGNGEGRWTAEVDATGNAILTNGTFVGTFEDGSLDIAFEGPAPGVRLGLLPVVPLAELVPSGTPALPAESMGEATPAP